MLYQRPTQEPNQPFMLLMEFLPEQGEERDPAFIRAIGRDTIKALQEENVVVQPKYTGQQGGDFLVEIITTVGQLTTSAWNHRTVIEEILNDSSTLVTLASFICLIINKVKHVYEQHVGHDESVARPVFITIELNGASFTVESLDPTQAKALIVELVQQSQRPNVHTTISPDNTIKIQSKIPRKHKGRKR